MRKSLELEQEGGGLQRVRAGAAEQELVGLVTGHHFECGRSPRGFLWGQEQTGMPQGLSVPVVLEEH